MDTVSTLAKAIEVTLKGVLGKRWTVDHVAAPMTIAEFKSVVQTTPFVGIAWTDTNLGENAGRSPNAALTMQLTFIVKNAGRAARLFGDDAGPGLYPAMEAVRLVIHGTRIEDIGTLGVTRLGQAYADGYGEMNLAIGTMEIAVTTRTTTIADPSQLPDFVRLVSDWDFSQSEGPQITDTIEPEAQT